VHLIWAGLILGVAAVFGVPIVSSILNSILPATVQPYLPSGTVPSVTTQTVITTLVYGLLLAGVLQVLGMVGVRVARR
jgi:hypothetical protein